MNSRGSLLVHLPETFALPPPPRCDVSKVTDVIRDRSKVRTAWREGPGPGCILEVQLMASDDELGVEGEGGTRNAHKVHLASASGKTELPSSGSSGGKIRIQVVNLSGLRRLPDVL